jgi:hypothetical protein
MLLRVLTAIGVRSRTGTIPASRQLGLMGIIVALIARAMLPTHTLLDSWRRGLCLSPNFGRTLPIHGRNPPTP